MTDYTTHYGLPYPEGDDSVVVHSDVENLARKTDAEFHKRETEVEERFGHIPATVTKNGDLSSSKPTYRIRDKSGQVAFAISGEGATTINRAKALHSPGPFRIRDKEGQIALEVDEQGRTHVYDSASGGAGGGVTQWHVFLAAGQSNMSGRGLPYNTELDPADPRILEFGSKDRTLRVAGVPLDMHDESRGLSPATSFARQYLREMPSNVGVILVPAARGGTTFTSEPGTRTWRPGAASDPYFDLYGSSVEQTLEALDAAGGNAHLKGVLWHQGEGNSTMTTAEYVADLDNLIAHYRDDLGDPNLPIMIGQMSREGIQDHPTRRNVDIAHIMTPARVHRTGFAPSSFGWASYDLIHYGRTGAEQLGHRYVDAYWQAIANTDDSQLLPPVNVTSHRAGDKVTVSWDAPPCRVTGYRIEHRPQDSTGAWTTITRECDMDLEETLILPEVSQIRVTALHDTETSIPVVVEH